MWQYTTETIINENTGNLPGGVRFGIYDKDGGNTAAKVPSGSVTIDANDFLLIDGVNTLVLKNIKSVYKTPYEAEAFESIKINLYNTTLPYPAGADYPKPGTTLRLQVRAREEGRVSSMFKNAYLISQKPFTVEIASTGHAADTLDSSGTAVTEKGDATLLAEAMNKMLGMSDFKFFTVSVDHGTASTGQNPAYSKAELILTAADCYVRFTEFRVDAVPNLGTTNPGAVLLGFQDYEPLVAWNKSTYTTKGKEGNGTVARLIKNLRIPTNASINPFAADQGGKPVPGGHYDQYLIEYVTDRYHVGGSVMGSVGEKSMTSHVLFIKNDGTVSGGRIPTAAGAAANFDTILTYFTGSTPALGIPAVEYAGAVKYVSGSVDDGNKNITADTVTGKDILSKKTPKDKGSVE